MKRFLLVGIALSAISCPQTLTAQAITITNVYKDQSVPVAQEATYPEWAYSEYLAEKDAAILDSEYFYNGSLVQTYSVSPKNFWKRTAWERYNFSTIDTTNTNNYTTYNKGPYYIAHRGLVDLKAGINENTLDAVQHASARGMNMVELDIQASSDGQAMLVHDDNLIRTTGGDAKVNTKTKAEIQFLVSQIANPAAVDKRGARTAATPRYCPRGHQVLSLDYLVGIMDERIARSQIPSTAPNRLGTCASNPGMTYFLDPKNLNAGIAAMKFIASDAAGPNKSKYFMKTYDNFWNDDAEAYWNIPAGGGAYEVSDALPDSYDRSKLQVMPVINVRSYLDKPTPEYTNAVNYAKEVIRNWSVEGFAIAAVEFPGAWDQKWIDFVKRFYNEIKADPETYYRANPKYSYVDAAGRARSLQIPPVLSYGYRFSDFKIGTQRYNWDMQGYAKVDNSNTARGRLGAEGKVVNNLCRTGQLFVSRYTYGSLNQTGCFVTVDFPHWEHAAVITNRASTYVGAPQTSFTTLP